MFGEPDRDLAPRTIELGLRLQNIERCVQRVWARCVPGALVVLVAQPGSKALAAKRPGFPVAVDNEVGKARPVACVKEPGSRCDIEETSVLLTAFDHRLLGLWQPHRTAIPSYHQRPKQSIESSRVQRHA
jgi:hypothetical protein